MDKSVLSEMRGSHQNPSEQWPGTIAEYFTSLHTLLSMSAEQLGNTSLDSCVGHRATI